MPALLSDEAVRTALDGPLSRWTRDGESLVRSVEASSFAAGIALVDDVAVIAEARDHHPDIDIRWTTVTFRLSTHSARGLTQNDLDLAAEIDHLAEADSHAPR